MWSRQKAFKESSSASPEGEGAVDEPAATPRAPPTGPLKIQMSGEYATLAADARPPEEKVVGVTRESALRVVKVSVIASAAAGLAGAAWAKVRFDSPRLGIMASANTAKFAFPIMAMREYVAIPLWEEYRDVLRPNARPATHMHHVLPTFLAAGFMGSAVTAYFSGRGRIIPAFTTFAFMCAGLQFTYNELRLMRVKVLALGLPYEDEPKPMAAAPVVDSTSKSGRSWFPFGGDSVEKEVDLNSAPSWGSRVWAKASKLSPVHRMSDAEYEQKLLREREAAMTRLKELDEIKLADQQRSV